MQDRAAATAAPLESRRREVIGICILLLVMVIAVFGQTARFDFVNYDDDSNVYQSPHVVAGLTAEGIQWAFTHTQLGRWGPVSTISRMVDCQVYHLWAGGHHLTNVALHALAAMLLFLTLLELTGMVWRSGFVAAVFALHPLHVEVVAWISARGELLCGVFFMMAVWSYAKYARAPSRRGCYALSLLCFALGLMSKPTMVTLPAALLLLDYWPLGRFADVSLSRLIKEKAPFLIGALCFCVFTYSITPPAHAEDHLPLWLRLENAGVSYCTYLGQTFWPVNLSVFYPDPTRGYPASVLAGSLALLCGISAAAYRLRRSAPGLLMGWLWFLGILVPLIGIVQISNYSHADRYTYLSQIGLCIGVTWAVAGWAGTQPWRRKAAAAMGAAILCALLVLAYRQTGYWRNGGTLFTHAIDSTQNNDVAQNDLGNAFYNQGWQDDALDHYREAVRINPNYADARANYAQLLSIKGHAAESLSQYQEAVRIEPDSPVIRTRYGMALFKMGRAGDAVSQFQQALAADPQYTDARTCLGNVMLTQGRLDNAVAQYEEALRINPGDALAHSNLCRVLVELFRQGRQKDAIADTEKALELRAGDAMLQNILSRMLAMAPRAAAENIGAGN